jgi:type II secretory ATPase GspE/PulE/Tfp pilus assembly ATPase PilB-like protein
MREYKSKARLALRAIAHPQEGVFKHSSDQGEFSVRVSTYPCVPGEKVTLQLAPSNALLDFVSLGMTQAQAQSVTRLVRRQGSLLLVAGPWSSGKTATLYSLAQQFNQEAVNVVSIEDPVELELPGMNQAQVNTREGLGYANGMRSIIRQDADVILCGEILDLETGRVVMDACLQAGLRVMSSVHCESALQAIQWMRDLGIRSDNLSHALSGIIVQRLLRKLCSNCAEPKSPGNKLREQVGFPLNPDAEFYVGKGCEICNGTGYKGRTGVFEIVPISAEMRDLILKESPPVLLKKALRKQGIETVRRAGMKKAEAGITTVHEVVRVT